MTLCQCGSVQKCAIVSAVGVAVGATVCVVHVSV